ncbi:hypothetical protein CRENBAI_018859 [Crenichthys baileyi]|uniref:Uncharacterized protein n=1 Tax=Crenichthys baileyi TaxID=28760 RepID=A0AAV9RCC2_9TELE
MSHSVTTQPMKLGKEQYTSLCSSNLYRHAPVPYRSASRDERSSSPKLSGALVDQQQLQFHETGLTPTTETRLLWTEKRYSRVATMHHHHRLAAVCSCPQPREKAHTAPQVRSRLPALNTWLTRHVRNRPNSSTPHSTSLSGSSSRGAPLRTHSRCSSNKQEKRRREATKKKNKDWVTKSDNTECGLFQCLMTGRCEEKPTYSHRCCALGSPESDCGDWASFGGSPLEEIPLTVLRHLVEAAQSGLPANSASAVESSLLREQSEPQGFVKT